jgi:hypothetical protein
MSGDKIWTGTLSNDADNKTACKYWSKAYYNLTTGVGGFSGSGKYVNFISVMSQTAALRPYSFGSVKSPLITKLRGGHVKQLTKEDFEKLCAWIDLCICYSGHYAEGMKPADSAAYIARFNKTRGAYITNVDKPNVQSFIADGQYQVGVYNPQKKNFENAALSAANPFKVQLSLGGGKLIVHAPCEGTLTVLDLSGRRIFGFELSKKIIGKGLNVPLKARLPRGLYIAKFKGVTITGQQTLAVL